MSLARVLQNHVLIGSVSIWTIIIYSASALIVARSGVEKSVQNLICKEI
ncbi:hypothetical protein [Campylobacter californiensis]|nr:hypothetical protein [Campylobacter sp. RM12916]MBE3610513.1 hypothetical protein [Campylobacter sp. RM12916]